jgi:high-affinity nickel-transport protein
MADARPSTGGSEDVERTDHSTFKSWSNKASRYHARVPYLSRLPFPALAIIVTLIVVNLLVWAGVGIVLVRTLLLLSSITLILIQV